MSSTIKNKAENLNNSIMVLTIDIGNGTCDKLKIYNINNYQEESYDFCAKNNLDFNTMKEINHQIEKVLLDSGIFMNEYNSKTNEENSMYQKKNQSNLKKHNYLNNFKNALNKRKEEAASNKKMIKRYNEKPMNNASYKKKDSNKSNNYSYLMSTSRGNTSSIKTSSNKEFNLKSNIKNAFHTIKGNTERNIDSKHNELKYSNKSNDIKSFRQNSNRYSGFVKDSHNLINKDENNKILFSYNHSRKNNESIKENKKVRESIQLNIDENKNEKNKKDEIMIIEFDSNDNNNKNEGQNSKKKNLNDKFNNILNSISLINNDNKKCSSNSEKIIYRSIKTESNEQKNNFNNLTNKSDIYIKSNMRFNYSKVDKIKNYKKSKEDKIKNLKELQEIQFKKLYTFRPLINHNINTEINQENKNHKRTHTSSRFDRLYDYRLSYKENKEKLSVKYEEKYSFHPKINSRSCYPLTKFSFNERLKLYSNKSKDAINKLQKSLERKSNSKENFNLILNTEKNHNILKEKEIKESLSKNKEGYKKANLYKRKYIEKNKHLNDKNSEEKNRTNRHRYMSNDIINNKKLKCFKNIFKILDNDDNDGKISNKNINIKSIPKDIRLILNPIFVELQNGNETLSESEFVFVCDKLYESLKYVQKQKLLSFENEKQMKDNIHLFKTKSNSTITTNISSEKGYKNLSRVSSCETGMNKKIRKNNEIKKINYYFSKPKYLMQINNFINEDKKIRENKNIINNISLSTFLKNKSSEKNDNINNHNTFNISNLVVQNLNNKIDKEIKFRNDDRYGKI